MVSKLLASDLKTVCSTTNRHGTKGNHVRDFLWTWSLSVSRECVWSTLWRYSEKVIAIIRATYDNATCHVQHRGKISDELEMQSGVRHGCHRYCFFLWSVTFFMLPCPVDMEEFNGRWHFLSNTSTAPITFVLPPTDSWALAWVWIWKKNHALQIELDWIQNQGS